MSQRGGAVARAVGGLRLRPRLWALATAAALLTGCAASPGVQPASSASPGRNSSAIPTRPDPGSTDAHPLDTLVSDPVFAALPPGSTKTNEERKPAHNETPVFGAGGTFGAGYSIDFTSTAAPQAVYDDLAKRAAAAGWSVDRRDQQGRAVVWGKAYPDGSRASLMLYAHDQQKTSPPYTYLLAGSI